jgi:hypothetical protein
MGLFDRHRLGDDVRASLKEHLAAEGVRTPLRVLAWAKTADGVLVGLPDRFALLGPGGVWRSLPWHHVLSATWDDAGTLFAWRTVARPHALESVQVSNPGPLAGLVRERVEQTLVARHSVELVPGVLVTVSGRRPAEGDGPIEWSVLAPRGTDLRKPEYADAVAALLVRVKRDWA